MYEKRIGQIIHDRRVELNLSMENVANAMGTTKATVSRWESGVIKNLKTSHIYMLSQILYLPVEALLGDDVPIEDGELISAKISLKKKIDSITDLDKIKQIDNFAAFIIKK